MTQIEQLLNGGKCYVVVHDGPWHANEVFAVALLQHSSLASQVGYACPDIAAVATKEDPVLVLDGERKLSSCGLIWRDFSGEVLQTAKTRVEARLERIRNSLDDLVAGIDGEGLEGFRYFYNVLAERNHWDFAQSLDWAGKVLDSLLSPPSGAAESDLRLWGDDRISLYPRMVSAIWGKGFSALVALNDVLQREIFSACLSYEEQAEKKAHA